MKYKSVCDVDVTGKRVLVRVDYNVPINSLGQVVDNTRILASIPTIDHLLHESAIIILCSHLGRPNGIRMESLSLEKVLPSLRDCLNNEKIMFTRDCYGDRVIDLIDGMQPRELLLLENTRFWSSETNNDSSMSEGLSKLADVFVNDAFGVAHRSHASTVGVANYLPSVAGLLLDKEIKFLEHVITDPERPFVAILGGAKISDKIVIIERLVDRADIVLVGGAMANTFLKASGIEVGDSLVEDDVIDLASQLLVRAGTKLVLPRDIIVADRLDVGAQTCTLEVEQGVGRGYGIVDIGPDTTKMFGNYIGDARMIIWNGPMGAFEVPEFARGTNDIARSVAHSNAISIVGGGDSAAAIHQSGYANLISHVSTGGGATLEILKGKTLPAVAVLDQI
jgi:phosphoglycerate kinase